MTERLERIEQITESNARAIQANAEGISELKNTISEFWRRVDEHGLQIRLINQIGDDQAGELAILLSSQADNDAQITALRQDAIADRLAFREQSEADRQAFRDALEADRQKAETDRQAFREALEADRAEWRAGFEAQQEVLQRLLLEIRSTNGEVKQLGERVSGLEAS
jgi:predicted amino acid-binding ACT domain protein